MVEVEGHAGPELAAELDAPGLTVVCRGPVADGAARDLRAGRVIILGDAGDALAYSQRGGTVLVAGSSGHRAGLGLAGGSLVMLGQVGQAGRRASERRADLGGRRAGSARTPGEGGAEVGSSSIAPEGDGTSGMEPEDAEAFSILDARVRPLARSLLGEGGCPASASSPLLRDDLTSPPA